MGVGADGLDDGFVLILVFLGGTLLVLMMTLFLVVFVLELRGDVIRGLVRLLRV